MMRLAGKIAVVVGAGQSPGAGIGNARATVLRFAQEGPKILSVDGDLILADVTAVPGREVWWRMRRLPYCGRALPPPCRFSAPGLLPKMGYCAFRMGHYARGAAGSGVPKPWSRIVSNSASSASSRTIVPPMVPAAGRYQQAHPPK
jgi:hypothetical protein